MAVNICIKGIHACQINVVIISAEIKHGTLLFEFLNWVKVWGLMRALKG